jgi:hypothetical protein
MLEPDALAWLYKQADLYNEPQAKVLLKWALPYIQTERSNAITHAALQAAVDKANGKV